MVIVQTNCEPHLIFIMLRSRLGLVQFVTDLDWQINLTPQTSKLRWRKDMNFIYRFMIEVSVDYMYEYDVWSNMAHVVSFQF